VDLYDHHAEIEQRMLAVMAHVLDTGSHRGSLDRGAFLSIYDEQLNTVDRDILGILAWRLGEGRVQYGPWPRIDRRPLARETFNEVGDALNYTSHALQNGKAEDPRWLRVSVLLTEAARILRDLETNPMAAAVTTHPCALTRDTEPSTVPCEIDCNWEL
jgi:hypothetical protein